MKLYLLVIVLGIGVAFAIIQNYQNKPKVGYVISEHLFEQFKGVSDAKHLLNIEVNKVQSKIDSLSYILGNLKALNDSLNTQGGDSLTQQKIAIQANKIIKHMELLASHGESLAKEKDLTYSTMVISQMNQYIKEYGKENEFDLILGTTNTGNVLYGDESIDLTNDLVRYINEQYEAE